MSNDKQTVIESLESLPKKTVESMSEDNTLQSDNSDTESFSSNSDLQENLKVWDKKWQKTSR